MEFRAGQAIPKHIAADQPLTRLIHDGQEAQRQRRIAVRFHHHAYQRWDWSRRRSSPETKTASPQRLQAIVVEL